MRFGPFLLLYNVSARQVNRLRRCKADFSELFSDFQLYEQKRRQQGRGEEEKKVFQPFQPEIFPREKRENPEYRSHAGEPDEKAEKLPFPTLFYFETHKFVFERDRGSRGTHAGGKLRELFDWLEEKQDEGKGGEGRGAGDGGSGKDRPCEQPDNAV